MEPVESKDLQPPVRSFRRQLTLRFDAGSFDPSTNPSTRTAECCTLRGERAVTLRTSVQVSSELAWNFKIIGRPGIRVIVREGRPPPGQVGVEGGRGGRGVAGEGGGGPSWPRSRLITGRLLSMAASSASTTTCHASPLCPTRLGRPRARPGTVRSGAMAERYGSTASSWPRFPGPWGPGALPGAQHQSP